MRPSTENRPRPRAVRPLAATAVLSVALGAIDPGPAAAADLLVLADRAHLGDGVVVEPAAVLVRDGRIANVATRLDTPPDVPVLDARGHELTAGFVDARSGAGLPPNPNEEATETTPSHRAIDSIDPADVAFERALRSGVTSVAVAPGSRAVVGGLVGVLKTARGRTLADRTVEPEAALFVTLGNEPALGNRVSRFQQPRGLYFRRPGNRMGVIAELRRAAFDASGSDAESDAPLRRAMRGEIPTFFRGRKLNDIRAALRVSSQAGFVPVLVEPIEAHRIPDEVGASGAIAVIGPFYQQPRNLLEYWEGDDFRHALGRILDEAGVPVAIGSGPDDPPDRLRELAILAHRAGLDRGAALDAITSVPARALGLEGRLGVLAPGADGDLVVLSGDPLDLTSSVAAVVIEGRVFARDPSLAPPRASARVSSLSTASPSGVPR